MKTNIFKHKTSPGNGGGHYVSPYALEILSTRSGAPAFVCATGALVANTGQTVVCARSTSAYCQTGSSTPSAQQLALLGPDTVRVEPAGLLVEAGDTVNYLHWNRDLTNAAWTKTNCTAAKNQLGVDLTVNGASLLTATGANATCAQSITHAGTQWFSGWYIKRVTGSGTVLISNDGVTFSDVTSQLNTLGYVRVSYWQASGANPVPTIKIVTSGDAIAVDLGQTENTSDQIFTSPIATTNTDGTRTADRVSVDNALSGLSPTTFRCGMTVTPGTTWAHVINHSTSGNGYLFEVATVDFGNNSWFAYANAGAFRLQVKDHVGTIKQFDPIPVSASDTTTFEFVDTNGTLSATPGGGSESGAGDGIVSPQGAHMSIGGYVGGDSTYKIWGHYRDIFLNGA